MFGCMVNAQRNYVREVNRRTEDQDESAEVVQAEGQNAEHARGEDATEAERTAE
ncbi:hypothetical protein [Halorhodospira halophila]|uniref:Uncharacterized protein n=1 Tax=Halorhodospira halophila (strain DSM 244 / SL1) TaxID=349124 RepID=A1WTH6_HALHL|nr:hypothetical protein [Halorhodospira halophila]ABM60988.1 hypothetical protein Hhal_0194 [Halorhodospira halophila SL1]